MKKILLIMLIVFVVCGYAFAGQTIYVDSDAPQFGDGTSWATAFKCLQDALLNTIPPAEIRVAQGVYKPDQGVGITPGDREATFQLIDGVAIKGGYAGFGEPDPHARDIDAHKTILSGDLNGDDGPDFANNGENSYHVVTGYQTDSMDETMDVLDGFTVTGGNADSSSYPGNRGGGMYCNSDATVSNCTFTGNFAIYGGGMYCGPSWCCVTYPTLTNCTFIGNSAGDEGGGLWVGDSDPALTNCKISGNSAGRRGGGVMFGGDNFTTMVNCLINGNSAGEDGGGIYGVFCYRWTMTNCTLTGNSAENRGGGIYNQDGSDMTLTNCILWGDSPEEISGEWTAWVTINHSCIQGGWSGDDNIDTDPLFVDANGADNVVGTEDDNLRLLRRSPCIDAGDNSAVPPSLLTDLDGRPRIINGTVDMGAYEFQILYVDDDAPKDPGPDDPTISDPLENGTEAHPFDTIHEAIDLAVDGYTVLVRPGSYFFEPSTGNSIDFLGKNITLTSADPTDWDIVDNTVIWAYIQFSGTEDPNCKFAGFKIRSAIYGNHTHATISHCNISGNGPCGATVIKDCDGIISNCLITDNTTFFYCGVYPVVFGCNGLIKNCTIANNLSGVSVGTATIENCIIYNNFGSQLAVTNGGTLNISYSNVQGGLEEVVVDGSVEWGPGNIDTDPCFVLSGYWEDESFELIEGDYHLRSEGWRWNTEGKSWTYDYITSRCVDAGNPGSPLGGELMSVPRDPNNVWGVNIRINMGAYGGTGQAGMPPHNWTLLADLNNNGTVNFLDFAYQTQDWLTTALEQPGDLNRDGVVNMIDLAALAENWLQVTDWVE